jgi:hypothetical protein
MTYLLFSWQWWVCCSEQASPPWFDRDGCLVSCSEEQYHLSGWLCPKDHWDTRRSKSNLQVCEIWSSHAVVFKGVSLCISKLFYIIEPGLFGRSSRKLLLTWLSTVAAILIKARASISTWIKQALGSWLPCTSTLGQRFALALPFCSFTEKFSN